MAHFSGAFADDAARVGGRGIDNVPTTPRLRPREPLPPVEGQGQLGATDDLVREGERDVTKKDVVGFTYQNFYDGESGEVALPAEKEFVESVVEQLAPEGSQLSLRLKAQSLHETLSDPEVDLASVAEELACLT